MALTCAALLGPTKVAGWLRRTGPGFAQRPDRAIGGKGGEQRGEVFHAQADTPQRQRQPDTARRALIGRVDPGAVEGFERALWPQRLQQRDGRGVQGLLQRGVGLHPALSRAGEVLRLVAFEVALVVGQPGGRVCQPRLEGERIDRRLERRSGGAERGLRSSRAPSRSSKYPEEPTRARTAPVSASITSIAPLIVPA